MGKKSYKWLLTLTLITALNHTVTANSLRALDSPEDHSIRVCLINWYPYSYMEKGELKGIYIDILNRVGWVNPLKFSMNPLLRCMTQLRQGEQHIWPFNSGFVEEMVNSDITTQYLISGVWVRQGSEHTAFTGFEQFSGNSLVIIRGHPLLPWLNAQNRSIQWQQQNSAAALWQMLISSRADAAFADYASVVPQAIFRDKQVRFLRPAVKVTELHIGVHPQQLDLLPMLNIALQRMQESGELDLIYQYYGMNSLTELKEQWAD